MRRVVFAVPGSLETPTGGYVYDRRIVGDLKTLGWQVDVLDLGEGFPNPGANTKRKAEDMLAAAPVDAALVVDGLALGVLPEAAARVRASHRLIALVHHPLAFETGLSEPARAALLESERGALAQVRGVIVTSEATKALVVAEYGVKSDAIAVVKPGNDRVPHAGRTNQSVALLAVGSVVPRKGYDVLVAALAMLKDLPWTLTIAGDRTRDAATAARVSGDIQRAGLDDRISLAGAVSTSKLTQMYGEADIFVLASRFEGYGMALADAIAAGLPVVATRAGAIPEAVDADASILVEPDDATALADALRRLIENKSEREMLAASARRAAEKLPSWRDQAMLFADAIEMHS